MKYREAVIHELRRGSEMPEMAFVIAIFLAFLVLVAGPTIVVDQRLVVEPPPYVLGRTLAILDVHWALPLVEPSAATRAEARTAQNRVPDVHKFTVIGPHEHYGQCRSNAFRCGADSKTF